VNPDFESLLSAERAEFLVVGAYAVTHHTEPRYTKDLDVWVRPTQTNARRVFRALKRFGAPGRLGRCEVAFLSVKDLITNKRKVGRPQDLLDVARLRALGPPPRNKTKR
jgi:hypothetical protein